MIEVATLSKNLAVFGYIRISGVLSESLGQLQQHFDSILNDPRDRTAIERRARYFSPSEGKNVTKLIVRDVVSDVLASVGSTNVILEEYNLLRGDTAWHRDGSDVPAKSYRIAAYLDPIGRGQGALSIIPSSHLKPDDWTALLVSSLPGPSGCPGRQENASELAAAGQTQIVSAPGDVIIFDCNAIHASFGGGLRRQIALVVVGTPETRQDREKLTKFVLNRQLGGTQLFGAPESTP